MNGRVVSADTNSSRRREFVSPIQHGCECCKNYNTDANVVKMLKKFKLYIYIYIYLYLFDEYYSVSKW